MLSFRKRMDGLLLPQILLMVFVAAFLIRLAFLMTKPHAWTTKLQAGDEPLYHGIAVSLVQGQGYSLDGQPTARCGPGYPVFLAGVYCLVGTHPPAARIANAIVGSLLCVILAIFAAILGGASAGVATGIMTALYYPFVQLPLYLLTENLYLPLFSLAALLTWRIAVTRVALPKMAITAGVLWGVAALTRPVALPLACLCSLWLFARRKAMEVGLLLVALAFVLFPWTMRNYQVFHGFAPVEPSLGHTLYLAFGPPGNEPRILGHWNWGSDVQRPKLPEGLSPIERDQWLKRQAWNYIKTNPVEAVIARIPRKLANLLTPFYGTASLPNKVLSTFCYLLLLALSLPTWWQAWRSNDFAERSLAELTLLVILFTVSFHAFLFGVVRYRYPVDALLLVFAGKALNELSNSLATRWRRGFVSS